MFLNLNFIRLLIQDLKLFHQNRISGFSKIEITNHEFTVIPAQRRRPRHSEIEYTQIFFFR